MDNINMLSDTEITRMEDGEIKSFESFLRILRTLGKIDVPLPLLEEEEIKMIIQRTFPS